MATLIMVMFRPSVILPTPKDFHSKARTNLVAAQVKSLQSTEPLINRPENLSDDISSYVFNAVNTPPPTAEPVQDDCQAQPCLALTFDDGPSPTSTPIILSALEKADAKATFFLVGVHVGTNTGLVQRMQADGDEIGNHSWTHPDFTKLTPPQIRQQIDLTQAAIAAAGVSVPSVFRPPYGTLNQTVAGQIGLPVILWNVDPKDWAQTDPNKIFQMAVAQAKPGAIIILHDKVITAAAVERIVMDLKTKFTLVTVSQLLNLTSQSQGIFRGR